MSITTPWCTDIMNTRVEESGCNKADQHPLSDIFHIHLTFGPVYFTITSPSYPPALRKMLAFIQNTADFMKTSLKPKRFFEASTSSYS